MKKILTFIFALIAMVSTAFAESDVEPNYLCFEVKAGTTISLEKPSYTTQTIQYSIDKKTWANFTKLTVNNDCRIYFKGENPNGLLSTRFNVSEEFKCSGNIMTLIDGEGKTTTIPNDGCFSGLFYGCPMTSAPLLPATNLTAHCYEFMFAMCDHLTSAPELPATSLAESCYFGMFDGCSELIAAPRILPATTLAESCYRQMFRRCSNLTSAPKLPATILAKSCYVSMFNSCISLTSAPELPATTLAEMCYSGMFGDCTSLATAPELPATSLTEMCYDGMFQNCTNIKKAPNLPATMLAEGCYSQMFYGCQNLQSITVGFNSWMGTLGWLSDVNTNGLFICPSDLPQKVGKDYIPDGWIVECSADDEQRSISTDEYTQTDKSIANLGDIVNVTFTKRNGYKLVSATVKGTALTIIDYKSSFAMPAENVDIKTVYTPIDYSTIDYLYFEVEKGTTISIVEKNETRYENRARIPAIQYSYDKVNWETLSTSSSITAPNDCIIYLKGVNPKGINNSIYNYVYFSVSQRFKCGGNIMTLIDGTGETTTIPCAYCFAYLFRNCPLTSAPELPATTLTKGCYYEMFSGCTNLTSVPELSTTILAARCYRGMFEGCTSLTSTSELPATTLAGGDYFEMFKGCTSLTSTPELPATNLASGCYFSMFEGCTNLTSAPELPSTTLAANCYSHMFSGCTSLTSAPELPATTLTESCYYYMFSGCTSLTSAPELPATSLAEYCYYNMFKGCTSLTSAPELPATTLEKSCYYEMFKGCTSLTSAPELPATTLAVSCYYEMFRGCTSLTSAPELPATTMEEDCYYYMLSFCTSLTSAPELPAITLAKRCYSGMFSGCTSLTIAPELPATTLAEDCYKYMFYNCKSLQKIAISCNSWGSGMYEWVKNVNNTGIFMCSPELPQEFGVNYIPDGWSVEYYADEKTRYILTDEWTETDKQVSHFGEMINVTLTKRLGYELSSVQLISNYISSLTVTDYKCSFTMPASDVTIQTYYVPIKYYIYTADRFVRIEKPTTTWGTTPTATINDTVYFTVVNRTSENLKLDKVWIYGTEVDVSNYAGSFEMKDYLSNVSIKAVYSKIYYTISTDDYSIADKASAKDGDEVTVTFTKRDGYNLTSASFKGSTLLIDNYKSSFIMPAQDIEIKTVYTPIDYSVSCADANITVDKTTATIEGKVNLTIKNRMSKGYKLDKVLVNSTEIAVQDFKAYFDMKDYLQNVTITAQYSKIPYTITTDEYSQVANTTANVDDAINVTFKQREGYNLTSATYNGTALTVDNYKSSFTMPAANVEIKTQYTKIPYTISTDEYSQVANTTANVGDAINVTFKQRDGYNLTSATYNGTALTVSNYKSSFTMPAANVEIKTVYSPITYVVSCADANITVDKTTATIEDKVNLTFKNRTSEGYKLDKVLVNSTEIAVKDFKASFDMKDYLKDVTISAQYSQIAYTITTDEYSQVVNTTAAVDDAISVTFKQREGFDLVSAKYNGNPLNINNYKASFTMPAQNVEIKTVYAEKEYEIAKPSEDVQISQPTAKAGDEINITVTIKDGYTAHLYVNGQEVALNGNLANYIMPSGRIEIKVEYVANPKTPVSEIYLDNCAVSVFPNPAKSGEKITLKVGGKFDTNNTKIYLYNASGSLVMQIVDVKEYNNLTLQSGVYVGVLVAKGGKKTFRVAVK